MNFDALKLDYFGHRLQMVCFKKSGELIASCNTITAFQPDENLYDVVVFLEGIKEQILALSEGDQLNYHCVNDTFGKKGSYDFGFELYDHEGEEVVLWYIGDFSFQYQQLIDLQQSRNESMIHRERLSQMNEKLSIEKQLLEEKLEAQPTSTEDTVFLKLDSLLVNFNIKEICLAEAYGDYVKIHTADEQIHVIYSTFKNVEEKLPQTEFARVHRSFLVRMDKIENIDSTNLVVNNKIVPISQKYRNGFMDKINTL